jgi:signal transduction histidine kinase
MEATTAVIGRRTAHLLRVLRQVVAPLAAALYLVLWIFAESGRWRLFENVEMFSLFAVAIGLSVWMPRTALGLVLATGFLQALNLVQPPQETTWATSAAAAYTVFFVGLFGRGLTRWLALPVVAVAAVTFGWVAAIPTTAWPYKWGSWVTSDAGPRQDAILLALSGFGVGVLAWLLGVGIGWILSRVRRDVEKTSTALEKADLDLRLAEDRARISRDVHDSLAHSLAVIVSQAQGARALEASRPGVATEALSTVSDVARTALVDVRMLVERIQGDGDGTTPAHAIADVPDLVEQMRSLGMRIDLSISGQQSVALTEAQQVAVYRIVQESLTNALKHAGTTSRVTVGLEGESTGLSLEVASEGDRPLVERSGRGIGVEGMKERARLAGGWLRAAHTGRLDTGGGGRFVVTAFVPAIGLSAVGVHDA